SQPSSRLKKSKCHQERRYSPSVASFSPISSCLRMIFSTSRSSTSLSCAALISPFSRLARASFTAAVRRIEPTWSARNGGLVLCMNVSRHGCYEGLERSISPSLRRMGVRVAHRIAGRLHDAAEGEEMRRDLPEAALPGKRTQRGAGVRGPEQREGSTAADEPAQGGLDAATPGEPQQGGEPRRPNEADMHGLGDAARAQIPNPGHDPRGIEAELAHDVCCEPGSSRGDKLVVHGLREPFGGDPRMALWVAGNADLANASGLQSAAFNDR